MTTTKPDFELSDIDSAFPRSDSKSVRLSFDDGTDEHVMTNLSDAEFRPSFLGKLIERCYYGRRDQWTKTSRLVRIEFT